MKKCIIGVACLLIIGCATVNAPSSYKFEPKDGQEFGTVILSNQSSVGLLVQIDGEMIVFQPGKKSGVFSSRAYTFDPGEEKTFKMQAGKHKIKWTIADSNSTFQLFPKKFYVKKNKKIKIIFPRGKLLGLIKVPGVSTKFILKEVN